MRVFLDTSALVALYNTDDAHHQEARATLNAIRDGKIPFTRFYTTDYIIDEALTYMSGTLRNHGLAVEVGRAILNSPFTTVNQVDAGIFQKAWETFQAHPGPSFTDCTSFASMEVNGVSQAFTYDSHFKTAGYNIVGG
jgi:predicted nucleic acid-binding protein